MEDAAGPDSADVATTDTDDAAAGEELSRDRTMDLLTSTGHGVLSLASEGSAYGLPISFGYDEAGDRFLFEFLSVGPSKKETFVETTDEATLTVYEFEDQRDWVSAVVTGPIEPVAAADLPEGTVEIVAEQSDDGAEDLQYESAEGLERQWYELVPSNVSGRRSSGTGDDG